MISDFELVYLARECNNKEAFELLYSRNFEKNFVWLYKNIQKVFYDYSCEFEDCRATMYESFLKAYETFEIRKPRSTFSKYIYYIGKNDLHLLIKKLVFVKKRKAPQISYDSRKFFLSSDFNTPDLDKVVVDQIYNQNLIEEVCKYAHHYYSSLNSKNQAENVCNIIKLRLEGLTMEEISDKLDISCKELSNLYFYFKKKVREEKPTYFSKWDV